MKLPFLLLAATLAGSWTLPATAEQRIIPCGKRADLVKALAARYREQPRAMGLASQTAMIEIFTSKAGTWTILLTRPNGASCIVSAGENWEENPAVGSVTSL